MNDSNFESGKIIVALNKNLISSHSTDYYINHILRGIDVDKVEVIFRSDEINNESDVGDVILVYLKDKDRTAVMDAVEWLSASPYVIYVEPDYLYDIHIVPNDQYFRDLWGMQQIQSTSAWNYITGSNNVVVGVLDSGIDYNHPDIRNNMWVSSDRQCINGWNFINNNNNPMDETGHGTHVAGTIGAVGNNFIGVTGVCWNVKLAALKIGGNTINLASAIGAINFANINNITILNNSWGGRQFSAILKYAIEQYDGLFIASAGNFGTDNDLFPVYPASYNSDNIISVAATNPDDTLASFSNFGYRSVHIAAPGTHILSTDLRGSYTYKNGTSMSAPHVAGSAALLKSYMPYLSTLEIKRIILSSSDRHPSLEGKILTGGILNVDSMIRMAISV